MAKLFGRKNQATAQQVPAELEQYYAQDGWRKWVRLAVGVIIVLVLLFGVFLLGRAAYRSITGDNDNNKTGNSSQSEEGKPKPESGQGKENNKAQQNNQNQGAAPQGQNQGGTGSQSGGQAPNTVPRTGDDPTDLPSTGDNPTDQAPAALPATGG